MEKTIESEVKHIFKLKGPKDYPHATFIILTVYLATFPGRIGESVGKPEVFNDNLKGLNILCF